MTAFEQSHIKAQCLMICAAVRKHKGSLPAAAKELRLSLQALTKCMEAFHVPRSVVSEQESRRLAQRAATWQWKKDKIAAGFCTYCFKNKAGGSGGTRRACPGCARARRIKASEQRLGQGTAENTSTVERLMNISATMADMQKQMASRRTA